MSDFLSQAQAILDESYPAGGPGAAALVWQRGQARLRCGVGLANIELNVPVAPEHIFRIGSVTKQFTAVAILMLYEQGKLDLQDEITRFLPDYPTRGEKITIEHLLTHTSGIPSYTEQPEWLPMMQKNMTPAEVAALTNDKPLLFKPGTKFEYNNTGYVLLGMIIEAVSGLPYARFMEENIFTPLGLAHTLYDDPQRLVTGRAAGYSRAGEQVINAAYISMTQPYSAGALAANVDDLALWNAALFGGKLLRPATLAHAHTPYTLADGRSSGYGYGWFIGPYEGWQIIHHGGGINGFTCAALSCPAEELYVAVLSNCDGGKIGPDHVALRLLGLALGKPLVEPQAAAIDPAVLDDYVGVYKIDESARRFVRREGDKLIAQRSGGSRLEGIPLGDDSFYLAEVGCRVHFTRDASGAVCGLEVIAPLAPVQSAPRLDEPLPEPRQAVELPPAALPNYLGVYELAPGMEVQVRLAAGDPAAGDPAAGGLEACFPGADEWVALLAEDPATFFIRQADLTVKMEFPAAGGPAAALTIHQGGEAYRCARK